MCEYFEVGGELSEFVTGLLNQSEVGVGCGHVVEKFSQVGWVSELLVGVELQNCRCRVLVGLDYGWCRMGNVVGGHGSWLGFCDVVVGVGVVVVVGVGSGVVVRMRC